MGFVIDIYDLCTLIVNYTQTSDALTIPNVYSALNDDQIWVKLNFCIAIKKNTIETNFCAWYAYKNVFFRHL